MVSTSILRNQSYWSSFAGMAEAATAFVPVGDRGPRGQSSTSGISRNGIQFYNLVQRASVGCWDTNKPYTKENLGVVEQNTEVINFPNDMKLDQEPLQNLWVLSNRLPRFLYAELNYNIVNFRILRTDVNRAVAGTICDPREPHVPVTSSADVCYEADLF
jgi:Major royal jelly protein